MNPTPLERLAKAIYRAVDEHGCPNSFGFRELEEHHGAPRPTTAGLFLKTRRIELEKLTGLRLRQMYHRSYSMVVVTREEAQNEMEISVSRQL